MAPGSLEDRPGTSDGTRPTEAWLIEGSRAAHCLRRLFLAVVSPCRRALSLQRAGRSFAGCRLLVVGRLLSQAPFCVVSPAAGHAQYLCRTSFVARAV